jgi:hypothetical protein
MKCLLAPESLAQVKAQVSVPFHLLRGAEPKLRFQDQPGRLYLPEGHERQT